MYNAYGRTRKYAASRAFGRMEEYTVLSLRYLLGRLRSVTVHAAIPPDRDLCPGDLEMLDTQTELLPDRIYLGEAAWLERLSGIQAAPGCLVLLAGAEKGMRPAAPEGCALALLSCPLPQLYNLTAQNIRRAELWRKNCQDLLDQDAGIHEVLRMAARSGACGAALLNWQGRVMDCAGLEESPYLAGQLSKAGVLPQDVMKKLFPPGAPQESWGTLTVKETGTAVFACRSAWEGDVLGILLLEGGEGAETDLQSLCACVMQCLRRQLLSRDMSRMDPEIRTFQRFWEDVMERRLINRMEIRSALSTLPRPVQNFLRVVVIAFKNDNIRVPYNYLLSRLRGFFPSTNMAVYQKDIILLYSHQERDFRPSLGGPEQTEKLTALLRRYDGFMMIGNGTRHAEAIASMYLLSKRTNELACLLCQDKAERIFFTEDYIIYSLIDLCVQRYLEAEQNEDILYLAHPAVTALTRYDRAHNANLRDVLFYFLLNDGNVNKTATDLYMHRNTVNNKVNLIKKLTCMEMDDPRLRQRLLISCQIMRYYENVMQKELQ